MCRFVPFFACLCFLALGWSTASASFDSAGQPSLANSDPAPTNQQPLQRLYAHVDHAVVVQVFNGVAPQPAPLKFIILGNAPPAKKPIRPRPLTK
jgi:hypothetical protein